MPGQYNVFFRILSELNFGPRYTITKNIPSDRFASIEYYKVFTFLSVDMDILTP